MKTARVLHGYKEARFGVSVCVCFLAYCYTDFAEHRFMYGGCVFLGGQVSCVRLYFNLYDMFFNHYGSIWNLDIQDK